jgi:nucleoside-diphosphate-sugar epimerase
MYIPVPFIKFFAFLFGKKMIVDRLFGTLQVDNSKAKKLLGWKPVISMEEELKKMFEKD